MKKILFIILGVILFLGLAAVGILFLHGKDESHYSETPIQEPTAESAGETANEGTPALSSGIATVHFIDVGQGDCTLIDIGKTEVLVDCGDAEQNTQVLSYISDYVDGDLDFLVATHPDADHIGGIIGILRHFTIGTLIDSGAANDTFTYSDYMDELKWHPEIRFMEDEDTSFSLGEDAELQIFETGDSNSDINEDSVVCLFRFGEVKVLLTGDMGIDTEEANMADFPKVDVLKAGHHGSAWSTGKNFLRHTRPDFVIISAGKDNDYGHPAPETLERIRDAGAISYCTIDEGTIILKTDGKVYNFAFTGPTRVEEPPASVTYSTEESSKDPSVSEAPYVGNVRTYKFHRSTCDSVREMKEKNKVYFSTREEAVQAEYEPCKNCYP